MSIPSNINTDITKISSAKTAIKNALINKGISVSNSDTFISYANKIGQLNAPDGYKVIVIDYDGELIAQVTKQTGETYTLPAGPTNHSKLVFQEWNSCDEITNNTVTITDHDILVGAVYTTASGLNEFDIELTEATGKEINFNITGTKNWGDGTSDNLISHTYADYGEYTITCDNTTINSNVMGGSYDVYNYTLKNVRLATVTQISGGVNAFSYCKSLETMTISTSLTAITGSNSVSLTPSSSIKCCILPSSITSTNFNNIFSQCNLLQYAVIPNINNLDLSSAFYNCYSLQIAIFPSNCINFTKTYLLCMSLLKSIYVPTLNNNCSFEETFAGCYGLEEVTFSASACNHITSLYRTFGPPSGSGTVSCPALKKVIFLGDLLNNSNFTYTFYYCYNLINIILPNNVKDDITWNYTFSNCYNLTNITLPSNVKKLGTSMFYQTHLLTSLTLPNISNVAGSFINTSYLKNLDFLSNTTVPIASGTPISNLNQLLKIKVPWNLYQEWVRAPYWSNIDRKYYYGGEPATLTFNMTPSNADLYVYDEKASSNVIKYVGNIAPYIVHNKNNNTLLVGQKSGIIENSTHTINADTTSGTVHTLTIHTGYSYCDVKIKINDNEFDIKESTSSPGNYTINIIGSANISYTVKYSLSYDDEYTGSIVFDGTTNVTENVTVANIGTGYYTDMVPITTNDQTHAYVQGYTYIYTYYLFDGNKTSNNINLSETYYEARSNDGYASDYGVVRKYDTPTILNKIIYYPYSTGYSYNPQGLILQGSNDGSNWTHIGVAPIRNYQTYLPNTNAITCEFNNYSSYTYYRFLGDYSSGDDLGNWRIYELDCPTFTFTPWSGINMTFDIDTNVQADYAYVTNSDGYIFELPIHDTHIVGIGNFTDGSNATLTIKKRGYAPYTETITASTSTPIISRNIMLQERPIYADLTPNITSYGWKVSSKTNPKASEGWDMYESDMKNINSNYAVMKVYVNGDIYSSVTLYINSYAEPNDDFTYCTKLDSTVYNNTSSSYIQGSTTSSKQYPPETFNTTNWTTITYTNIPSGMHFFYVVYKTNSNSHQNYDAGFVLIDTHQST